MLGEETLISVRRLHTSQTGFTPTPLCRNSVIFWVSSSQSFSSLHKFSDWTEVWLGHLSMFWVTVMLEDQYKDIMETAPCTGPSMR